jgi:UTP--glucose-1-phosphate uridylyltransferase
MSQVHAKHGGSVIAVQNVERKDTPPTASSRPSPWPADFEDVGDRREAQARGAPSTLGVVGRYVLSPRIFHYLENLRPGRGREIQLTDAIGRLLREEACHAYEFEGQRYDCGSKLGYLQATVTTRSSTRSRRGISASTSRRSTRVARSNED